MSSHTAFRGHGAVLGSMHASSAYLLFLVISFSNLLIACESYALRRVLPPGFNTRKYKLLYSLRNAPVVRDLQSNDATRAGFTTNKSENLVALFIQLSGEEASKRCLACAQLKGVWAQCVITSDDLLQRSTKGACANCYYNGQASRCSFRPVASGPSLPTTVNPVASTLSLPTTVSPVQPSELSSSSNPANLLGDLAPDYSDFLRFDAAMLDMLENSYRSDMERSYRKLVVDQILVSSPSRQSSLLSALRDSVPEGRELLALPVTKLEPYQVILHRQIQELERKLVAVYLARKYTTLSCPNLTSQPASSPQSIPESPEPSPGASLSGAAGGRPSDMACQS